MSARPLAGVGVLVTRPEHQALPLCLMLEGHGATTHRFATTQVLPRTDPERLRASLRSIGDYDLIVFISPNAVRFGAALLATDRLPDLAAVGPATARALGDLGHRVAILATESADSEGLLAHPRLRDPRGRRILLVKGAGGRDVLAAELTRRGAVVESADVYERRAATPSARELAELEQGFAAGRIQVITATSLEIGANYLDLATPALRMAADRALWVVASERIGAGLKARGLDAPLLTAASAQDRDLLAALLAWRKATPP